MLISLPRLIPHILLFVSLGKNSVVSIDMIRWAKILPLKITGGRYGLVWLFVELMTFNPEFRNVFYLRCGIASIFISWMCPSLPSLQITPTKIGPGFFIQHGFGTLIAAREIGANCWISQQVAVGFSNDTDSPTIGDNVTIFAGAKVIGNIRVGDNATIGANTVVIGDVPSNVTVLGVPGKIIWSGRSA
jgi:serine O-acetyltransferase